MQNNSNSRGGYWGLLVFLILIVLMWWGLAFYPVQGPTAEWLKRTQSVCFGLGPNGLPNSGGWILLTLAPILLAISLWFIAGKEIQAELSMGVVGAKRKKVIIFLLGMMLAVFAWAGNKTFNALSVNNSIATFNPSENTKASAFPENYPRLNLNAPSFVLVNQYGNANTNADFKGKAVMFVYVYAHCASICPTLVRLSLAVKQEIQNPNFQLVYITLDPERDTPSSLPDLFKEWKLPEGSLLLSGQPKIVNQVLDEFNVPHVRDDKTGEITHPSLVTLLDRHGKIAYHFNNPSKDWLVHAAKILLSE